MKDFIKRNMPTFVIGGITLGIFLAIIVASSMAPKVSPDLLIIPPEELIASYTPVKGSLSAKVTLVEFSDFECPACAKFEPYIKQVSEEYKDNLKVAYRNFPLPKHTKARYAAEAAMAAGEQGKFWEYGETLFTHQDNLEESDLIGYAQALNLNVDKFKADLQSGKFKQDINQDIAVGNKYGVSATPTFYLNGKKLTLTSFDSLREQVKIAIDATKDTPAKP